ncbi:MAG: hypothetical protein WCF18_01485 [Chthoniobacteraceae bacterium]
MSPDLLQPILRSARSRPLWQPGGNTTAVAHRGAEIQRILPQRGSFFLLDEIDAIDLPQRALRARRHLPAGDIVFAEHFPGEPVYPAALTLEILGQAGICAVDFVERNSPDIPADRPPRRVRVIKVHRALLLQELHPGDDLTILASVIGHDDWTSIIAAQALRGEAVCTVAIFEFLFLDR